LQRHLDRLGHWAVIDGMKVKKSKCHILPLGQSTTRHKYKLGGGWPESRPAEGPGGAGRVNPCTLGHTKPSTTREVTALPSPALVWPHLEHRLQFWAPQPKEDVKVLECVQRRATKLVEGLEGASREERLRALGLSSLETRRLRSDPSLSTAS